MAVIHLEESTRGRKAASTDVDASRHPAAGSLTGGSSPPSEDQAPELVRSAEQNWIYAARGEIDDYMVKLRQLNSMSPDEVFAVLSAITARLAELRLFCVRSESRRLAAVRSREIDPTIDECDRQFRLHSRIQSVRQHEIDQTRYIT